MHLGFGQGKDPEAIWQRAEELNLSHGYAAPTQTRSRFAPRCDCCGKLIEEDDSFGSSVTVCSDCFWKSLDDETLDSISEELTERWEIPGLYAYAFPDDGILDILQREWEALPEEEKKRVRHEWAEEHGDTIADDFIE